jgi:uncharacterized RDD family membrane protein YckC
MSSTTGLYAGFWRRVAASFLDSLVLLIPSVAIHYGLGRHPWAALAASAALSWIYKAGLESSARQATLGKQAMGLKVTDLQGEPVSFLRASGRYFGMVLSYITLFIGFAAAGFTPRRQCFHDMVAGCLVVRRDAEPEEVEAGGRTMPMTAGVWLAVVFFLLFPVTGILAAIAIPAYQDYTVRAKMTEVIAEGRVRQAEVTEEMRAGGAEREIAPNSRYVKRIIVRPADRTLVMMLELPPITQGASIRFHLEDDGSWTCAGNGVRNQYLPSFCRH